jgi:hypothetical protein
LEAEAHRSLLEQFQARDLEWRLLFDGMNMQIVRLHNEIQAETSQRAFYAEAEARVVKPLRQELAVEIFTKESLR